MMRVSVTALCVWSALLVAGCTGGSPQTSPQASGAAHRGPAASASTSPGIERRYYLAADQVRWNYAPTGQDVITGKPFDATADVFVKPGPGRIGSTYTKCIYRGYTDSTFTRRTTRADAEAYLGFLGPVLHAAVGDRIRLVFRNNCSFPASVHPHGVLYAKGSEGAPYADGTSSADKADDAVPTGGTHIYEWEVPERAGPGPMDGSSVMWMYHSHTHEIGDTYAGLMGPMVVTAAEHARADGAPEDVDRELFYLYTVMNENQSPFLSREADQLSEPPHEPDGDEEFNESNLMHSINGYVYGNGPIPTVRKGEHVRWYVMSMGTEVDLHTPHWHGNTVLVHGMRMDNVDLLPASMVVADMTPDDPGTWLFHCHVNDHIAAGMQTLYRVTA